MILIWIASVVSNSKPSLNLYDIFSLEDKKSKFKLSIALGIELRQGSASNGAIFKFTR